MATETEAPNSNGATAEIAANLERIRVLNEIAIRSSIASALGQSYGGDRDIYTALGYKKLLTFSDFLRRYERQDIASAIIDRPAEECWRLTPKITETSEVEDTPFEKAWATLAHDRDVWHYLLRADKLSGIGQFSVILLGLNDGAPLNQPATKASELNYLMPYSQGATKIKLWEKNPREPRFGRPTLYEIAMAAPGSSGATAAQVHWSRVVHVVQEPLNDDVYGRPALESVFNRLQDIELITGGSAEMFWRGAFPGISFELDKDGSPDTQGLLDAREQIENYIHGLERYMRLQGIKANQLAIQVADPTSHISTQLDMISAAKRMPKRILLGSERGELASSTDERMWIKTLESRRLQFCERVLRAVIDRLIEATVLPTPSEYRIEWPALLMRSEQEESEIGLRKAQAIRAYQQMDGQPVMPLGLFRKLILRLNPHELAEAEATAPKAVPMGDVGGSTGSKNPLRRIRLFGRGDRKSGSAEREGDE